MKIDLIFQNEILSKKLCTEFVLLGVDLSRILMCRGQGSVGDVCKDVHVGCLTRMCSLVVICLLAAGSLRVTRRQ